MLTKKSKAAVIVMFLAAVLFTGRARLALDVITESFRDDFREMVYLPRGETLKLLACGFEAPLADALFVKSLIYYAESFDEKLDKTTRRQYIYELFDVITDLSPRFTRAYQMGSIFLSASVSEKSNRDSVKLLDKGIGYFAGLAAAGEPVPLDPRWLFHTLAATTYEVNLQAHRRRAGDAEGAAADRQAAGREFHLAASSPGAPQNVIAAARGYQVLLKGQGNIEMSQLAAIAVYEQLYNDAAARNDKDLMTDMEARLDDMIAYVENVKNTRALEAGLGRLGREYFKRTNEYPVSVSDLVEAKLLSAIPPSPLATETQSDAWMAMPDGTFKSRQLALMESASQIDLLVNAVMTYRRANNKAPPDAEALVREKYIDRLPVPPLKELGQRYDYNPQVGAFVNVMPVGPEPPPAPMPDAKKDGEENA